MKSEFDKIKNIFDDASVNLPEDFSWDQMEEGIMDKMNAMEPKTEKSSRRIWFFMILALLFMGVPTAVFFYSSGLDNSKDGNIIPNNKSDNSDGTRPSAAVPGDNSACNGGDVHDNNSLETAVNEDLKARAAASLPAASGTKVDSYFKNDGHPIFTGNKKGNIQNRATGAGFGSAFINDKAQREKLEENSASPHTAAEEVNTADILSVHNNSVKAVDNLAFLPPIAFKVHKTDSIESKPLFIQQYTNAEESVILPVHQMGLTTGISQWTFGYGNQLPERNSYEKNILSFSTQLSYTYSFGNQFTFSTGFQYQQLESRLVWSRVYDDYTIVLTDTIVEINTNTLTGEQMAVRGNVEIDVAAVRNIRHYNQYRLYQVPLLIGKSWMKGPRWQMNISAGGAINIHSFSKGRNVYGGDLIGMNGPVSDIVDNRWTVQFQAQYGLGYRFNEKWGLLAQLGYQKSLTNWSRETTVQMRPGFINLNFGVNYVL
jgi:hypothetical protein